MSENKMLTYGETIDLVEKFMIAAEIRRYCTDICKGSCCASCYKDNKEACHKQEGRRLSCSIFICYSLTNLLISEDVSILSKVRNVIEDEYNKFSLQNPYFNKPKPRFLKQARFPSESIEALNTKMSERIKKIMTILITNKKNIRKNHTSKKYIEERL